MNLHQLQVAMCLVSKGVGVVRPIHQLQVAMCLVSKGVGAVRPTSTPDSYVFSV